MFIQGKKLELKKKVAKLLNSMFKSNLIIPTNTKNLCSNQSDNLKDNGFYWFSNMQISHLLWQTHPPRTAHLSSTPKSLLAIS